MSSDDILGKLSKTLLDEWIRNNHIIDKDSKLYHYTNSAGLDGILKSNRLWATHYSFLNDSVEAAYGYKMINNILDILIDEEKNEMRLMFYEAIIKGFIGDFDYYGTYDFYVTSFCEEESDLLSQWKGYANHGNGYSLCFKADSFRTQHYKEKSLIVNFKKVIYERTEQLELIVTILDKYYREIEKYDSAFTEESLKEYVLPLLAHLMLYIAILKHPTFKEEREWRLIYHHLKLQGNQLEVFFRYNESYMIPFVELELNSTKDFIEIENIICGPKVDFSLAQKSLDLFCKEKKRDKIIMKPSEIPLC